MSRLFLALLASFSLLQTGFGAEDAKMKKAKPHSEFVNVWFKGLPNPEDVTDETKGPGKK